MKKILFVLIVPLTLIISGCFGVSNEFRNYQKDFAKYSDIKTARKDVELSFGRFTLYMAEKLTGYVDSDLLAEMTIHDISKFEIGIYEIREYKNQSHDEQVYDHNLKEKGWIKFIKTSDGEDFTNILIKLNDDGDQINEMVLETVDGENIILMRFEGNFNRIVKRLIKARKLALE